MICRKKRDKSKWGGQRVLLGREKGWLDVWGRRVGYRGGWGGKLRMPNKKRMMETALQPVECTSRADAETSSPYKLKALTYTLYSNFLSLARSPSSRSCLQKQSHVVRDKTHGQNLPNQQSISPLWFCSLICLSSCPPCAPSPSTQHIYYIQSSTI